MTFEVLIDRIKAFEEENTNEMFKNGFGEMPMIDINVDFHTRDIYERFLLKHRNDIIISALPYLIQTQLNSMILEKMVEEDISIKEKIERIRKSIENGKITEELLKNAFKIVKENTEKSNN